jgi:hypothetical protein
VLGIYISEERNMIIAEKFIRSRWKIWKIYSLHRWRYMISRGMQYNWIKTLFTFTIREEFDGKS